MRALHTLHFLVRHESSRVTSFLGPIGRLEREIVESFQAHALTRRDCLNLKGLCINLEDDIIFAKHICAILPSHTAKRLSWLPTSELIGFKTDPGKPVTAGISQSDGGTFRKEPRGKQGVLFLCPLKTVRELFSKR